VVFEELLHQLCGLLLTATAEPFAVDALVVDLLGELVVVAGEQVGVQFVDRALVGLAAEFALFVGRLAAARRRSRHLVVPLFRVVEQADVAGRNRGGHLAAGEAGHEAVVNRGGCEEAVAAVFEFDLAGEVLRRLAAEVEGVDVFVVDALLAVDGLDKSLEGLLGSVAVHEAHARAERFLAGLPEHRDSAVEIRRGHVRRAGFAFAFEGGRRVAAANRLLGVALRERVVGVLDEQSLALVGLETRVGLCDAEVAHPRGEVAAESEVRVLVRADRNHRRPWFVQLRGEDVGHLRDDGLHVRDVSLAVEVVDCRQFREVGLDA